MADCLVIPTSLFKVGLEQVQLVGACARGVWPGLEPGYYMEGSTD